MYDFDVIIYEDAVSLLLNDKKPDVRAEILGRLQQDDDVIESIGEELQDFCDELGLAPDEIDEIFEKFKVQSREVQFREKLMNYISFSEKDITFDYGESEECGNRKLCAFRIACSFDLDRYLKDVQSS